MNRLAAASGEGLFQVGDHVWVDRTEGTVRGRVTFIDSKGGARQHAISVDADCIPMAATSRWIVHAREERMRLVSEEEL